MWSKVCRLIKQHDDRDHAWIGFLWIDRNSDELYHKKAPNTSTKTFVEGSVDCFLIPYSFWHHDVFAFFSIHIQNQWEIRFKTTDCEQAIDEGRH